MREHQIVINLKADQFLKIQQLSKAADAKSMGSFVRDQLLAALGIEGGGQNIQATGNIDPIVNQLKLLHSELKQFVADTLTLQQENPFIPMEPPPWGEEIPQATDASNDELEELARRTFAISPRLGAAAQSSDGLDPLQDLLKTEVSNEEIADLPLSLAERAKQMSQPQNTLPQIADFEDDTQVEQESPAQEQASEELPPAPPPMPTGTAPIVPPFAGGPPPKKRK